MGLTSVRAYVLWVRPLGRSCRRSSWFRIAGFRSPPWDCLCLPCAALGGSSRATPRRPAWGIRCPTWPGTRSHPKRSRVSGSSW